MLATGVPAQAGPTHEEAADPTLSCRSNCTVTPLPRDVGGAGEGASCEPVARLTWRSEELLEQADWTTTAMCAPQEVRSCKASDSDTSFETIKRGLRGRCLARMLLVECVARSTYNGIDNTRDGDK